MDGADHEIIVIADSIGVGRRSSCPIHTLADKDAAAEMADALAVTSTSFATAGGVLGGPGRKLWGPAVVAPVVGGSG